MKKNQFLLNVFLFIIFVLSSSFKSISQTNNSLNTANELEIGVVEHLDSFIPNDIYVINTKGDTIILNSLVNKPTILNLVYYRCPGICSPQMDGVAEVIDKSNLILGKDYQIITISFDPKEDISLAKRKRKNYLGLLKKKEEAKMGWNFFVTDSTQISKITNTVGFKYKKTGNDFLHTASLIVLSPESKIVRYLNGTYFLPFEWKMAILEASKGKSGPTLNKILQFCYTFDPEGQIYVMSITRVTGILLIFGSIVLLLILFIDSKRRKIRNNQQK